MKDVLGNILNFNVRLFLKFCDCMHIKNNFSQAKLQVGQSNFHHNSNLDVSGLGCLGSFYQEVNISDSWEGVR